MRKQTLYWSLIFTVFISCAGLSDSGFSKEDIKYIKLMKKQGLIPRDQDIPLGYVAAYKKYLKEKLGIDDIDSIGRPDKRFSSPDKTWRLYKSALIAGDFELAHNCLMPRFAEEHDAIRKAIGDEKMKEKAKAMRPIEKVTEEDEAAKYRIKRKMGDQDITFYIYFVRVFGNWKILRY
jgi:hypothetical protein